MPGSGIRSWSTSTSSFSIIDRLLGGPGWFPNKLRDLTEHRADPDAAVHGAHAANSYRESWNYLLTLSLKIEALDSNPKFIPRIIPLDQIVAYISMELKVGDYGRRDELLPALFGVAGPSGSSVEPISSGPRRSSRAAGMTEEDIQQLTRNVERAGVEIEVELGRTMVSLRDLVALNEGDVVVFDKPTKEPLLAKVNDKEKFRVFPGLNKDPFDRAGRAYDREHERTTDVGGERQALMSDLEHLAESMLRPAG